ncbi:Acyloxyacyl hydrolase [Gryllus bimaculatus]|nr:Acyloxyacyl hydrolase [Gryllus bimaculatus]
MKVLLISHVLFLLFALHTEGRGVNGGWGCATCTVVFGITGQLSEIYNETIFAASLRFCHLMPHPIGDYCHAVVQKLEPILINKQLTEMFTPDVLCYGIGFCYIDSDHGYCHLFPRPQENFHKNVLRAKTARGSHWRGRDCRDWDFKSYPGTKPVKGDKYFDSNCNGIWGVNEHSDLSWEETLCDESNSRGLIVLGDSVSAHFHFPEVWMNPKIMSSSSFQNLTEHLLDELDWPQLGFMTGYENSSEPLLIKDRQCFLGKSDSIYWRLRNHNRCNHRDYQNVCRNGANSFDILSYVENVARNHNSDKPALVLYAAVGNDVCNSYKKTIENMTTPEQLRNNVLQILEKLNSILPNRSHVILIGLVDGGFIFPTMANRIHPLGKLHGDIRYKDVYQWFTCMEIGPCVGWMTPNETLRHFATKRAKDLSQVLQNISLTHKFDNFELNYLDNPFHKVVQNWKSEGKPLWQIIDQIDSLHPAQAVQSLITDALWQDIMEKFPHVLGEENQHNSVIQQLFGDQGGH